MKILITGVAGSIGSELLRKLAPNNEVYGVDINETGVFDLIGEHKQEGHDVKGRVGDIKDIRTIEDIFTDFEPEIVYHAAAYKHVTPMEWHPLEAIQTNIIGTYNLLCVAKRAKIKKFVLISTDKAVHPHNVMGASKRMCEIMVKNQGDGFVVVRFANVLGSRGSVIPIWKKQLDKGKNLTITDERMERFFMSIGEAIDLIVEAGEIGKGGEIIVLDMGKRIKIIDLANKMIKDSGKGVGLDIIGSRPGERLKEDLMSKEEEESAIKQGRYWIIK